MDNNTLREISNQQAMYGARKRRSPERQTTHKFPPKLMQQQNQINIQRLSTTKQPIPFPTKPSTRISTSNGYSLTVTKVAIIIVGVVLFIWLKMISIVFQLDATDISSSMNDIVHSPHKLRRTKQSSSSIHHPHENHVKLPKNYYQLSPPIAYTDITSNDSPPWSWPIIHIVTTRFQQEQGTLVNLARSRLKLLEVITLPSLMKQTMLDPTAQSELFKDTKWEKEIHQMLNNNKHKHHKKVIDPIFLWIIKVDPNLDKSVLHELQQVLEPVKHFTIVVGSNTNFGIGVKAGGWRGGEAGQDILDAFDNGHNYFPANENAYQVIRRAHEARNHRVVLETRIDADDGVNVEYFATLHDVAIRHLVDPAVSEYVEIPKEEEDDDESSEDEPPPPNLGTAKWLYWCPNTHVQWNPSSSSTSDTTPGLLQVFQMPMTCVTAGLTLGFAIGSKEEDVPRYPHTKIYWEIVVNHNNKDKKNMTLAATNESNDIHDCGLYPSSNCAVFVQEPRVSAFRTRAMTSAGMHNIEAQGQPSIDTPQQYKDYAAGLWKGTIHKQFGISTSACREAAAYMVENYLGTVQDNLESSR